MPQYDLVFTLGRTQPPHEAHYRLLLNALSELKDTGTLIHFIGSPNVPQEWGGENILSFDQRQVMLTRGLERMLQSHPRITPKEFHCIPLPDFSGPTVQFSANHHEASIAYPPRIIREEGMAAVIDEGFAVLHENGIQLTPAFRQQLQKTFQDYQKQFHIDVTPALIEELSEFTHDYLGWGVFFKRLIDAEIVEHAESLGVSVSEMKVLYPSSDKDKNTLKYLMLLAAVFAFSKPDYLFELRLIPIEAYAGEEKRLIHATDIRQAFMILMSETVPSEAGEIIQDLVTMDRKTFEAKHPEEAMQYSKLSVIKNMNLDDREMVFKALCILFGRPSP